MKSPANDGLLDRTLRHWQCSIPLVLVLIWCFGADFFTLLSRWWTDPDYLHGFLVVPFSIFLLWYRRSMLAIASPKGSNWGLALIGLAILMKCFSAYISDPLIGPLSLVPSLAGVVLFVGGVGVLRWCWPSIVFLVFMFPLPSFVASWGNLQLQHIATVCSTFVIQSIGIPAVGYGNTIVMTNGNLLGIAEACSGLRSTMLFFAVSVGATFIVHGLPEKVTVLLSAIPATIIANVARISATGVVQQWLGSDQADFFFHDVFGFFMLPLAALIVWGEIVLIRNLLVSEDHVGPLPLSVTQDARHTSNAVVRES